MNHSAIIKAQLKPISLNHSHKEIVKGKRVMRIKSNDTMKWIADFTGQSLNSRKDLQKISESFKDTEHYIEAEYYYFFPKTKILTKKGNIHKKKFDTCNLQKIPNDVLSKIIEVDDAQFVHQNAIRLISPDNNHHIVIKLTIRNLDELVKLSSVFAKKFL